MNSKTNVLQKTIRCPSCSNYMKVDIHNNNSWSGQCKVCKAVVYGKQHRPRETLIKVISAS